jgi:hypothetical protein
VEPDKSLTRMNQLKMIAAAIVAACGASLTVFPPESSPFKVCTVVVAVGSAIGIVSRGRQ